MQPTHFFFDVDCTVVNLESLEEMVRLGIDELSDVNVREKTLHELLTTTQKGVNGEIDLSTSLVKRLTLVPLERRHLTQITDKMTRHITNGMTELIHDLTRSGHTPWLLTAGIKEMMLPLGKALGIPDARILANEVMYEGNRIVGLTPSPLLTTDGKTDVINNLKQRGLLKGKIVMIGDGYGDLQTFLRGAADDFYGFGEHGDRPKLVAQAPHFFRSVADMRAFMAL